MRSLVGWWTRSTGEVFPTPGAHDGYGVAQIGPAPSLRGGGVAARPSETFVVRVAVRGHRVGDLIIIDPSHAHWRNYIERRYIEPYTPSAA